MSLVQIRNTRNKHTHTKKTHLHCRKFPCCHASMPCWWISHFSACPSSPLKTGLSWTVQTVIQFWTVQQYSSLKLYKQWYPMYNHIPLLNHTTILHSWTVQTITLHSWTAQWQFIPNINKDTLFLNCTNTDNPFLNSTIILHSWIVQSYSILELHNDTPFSI